MNGKFITFEGVEGCGKSTQAKLLADELKVNNYKVLLTREPGGPPISEEVRKILLDNKHTEMDKLTEFFLYIASRTQHTIEWIKPALTDGFIVICDRYFDSTYAYQGAARNIPRQIINRINKLAIDDCIPDMTFLLDLPVENGLQRLTQKSSPKIIDRLEREEINFHKEVRNAYLKIYKEAKDRIILIDAKKPVDIIHKNIMINIKKLLIK